MRPFPCNVQHARVWLVYVIDLDDVELQAEFWLEDGLVRAWYRSELDQELFEGGLWVADGPLHPDQGARFMDRLALPLSRSSTMGVEVVEPRQPERWERSNRVARQLVEELPSRRATSLMYAARQG